MSASASADIEGPQEIMALAGQLLVPKAETSRTNRELKLRGRLLRPFFHRRGHAIGVLRMMARWGGPFSPTDRAFDKLSPWGSEPGAFSSPPKSTTQRVAMKSCISSRVSEPSLSVSIALKFVRKRPGTPVTR